MTINVQVLPVVPVVTVKQTSGGLSTNTVTVATTMASGSGASAVGQLTDVDTSAVVDGATLVYNSNTHTYVVEQLPAGDISGPIDGGLF